MDGHGRRDQSRLKRQKDLARSYYSLLQASSGSDFSCADMYTHGGGDCRDSVLTGNQGRVVPNQKVCREPSHKRHRVSEHSDDQGGIVMGYPVSMHRPDHDRILQTEMLEVLERIPSQTRRLQSNRQNFQGLSDKVDQLTKTVLMQLQVLVKLTDYTVNLRALSDQNIENIHDILFTPKFDAIDEDAESQCDEQPSPSQS